MMETTSNCPECGAVWSNGQTCTDHFHQMLFWEAERPELGVVHHLMVLCYHLQHPSLYSPEGLAYGQQLLHDFVVKGISPAEVRQNRKGEVNSKNRQWKVTARPDARGSYDQPVAWKMTAADVVAGGADAYIDNVRLWASLAHDSLVASRQR
ncbi:MAG: DUF5946 family protein [Anaerolineae bacterium]